MSKRFETLFALDKNLYATDSPVIISAGVLLRDTESNRLAAQLKFRNVSSKTIWALTVTLACVDTGGKPTAEDFTYQYQDLTAGRGEEFGSKKAILIPNNNTRGFRITALTAVFSDGSTQSIAVNLSPLPEITLLDSELNDRQLVKQYRLATNDCALYVPASKFGLCFCPCGNWHSQPYCSVCGLSYVQAKNAYDLPTLTAEKDIRLAQEEADREEARRAEAYDKALKLMEHAKLPVMLWKAEAAFAALGDYRDCTEKALECREILKTIALKKAEAPKNVYDLKEAEKIFLALGDMEGCAELAEQCHTRYEKGTDKLKTKTKKTAKRIVIAAAVIAVVIAMIPISINYIIPAVKYSQAEKLASNGQYDEAIAAFKAMGDYKDAQVRMTDTQYDKAEALMAEGAYTEAAAIFDKLDDYLYSRDKLTECTYLYAKDLMALEQYEDAIKELKKIGKYEDAPKQLDACYLALAEKNYSVKDFDTALAWYTKISDFDTSNANYVDSVYQSALQNLEKGNYKKAASLFSEIPDHADSAAKQQEAMLAYVEKNRNNTDTTTFEYLQLLKEQEYAGAAELYDELYSWQISATVNTDPDSTENMDTINKMHTYHFRICISGGQPNETLNLYAVTKQTDGTETTSDVIECKNGDILQVTSYSYRKAGTASITVFDSNNNILTTHNVRIK